MSQNLISQIDCIFHPKSLGIVGASNREGSFGRLFLEGLLRMGYKNIYPVHPRDKEILGFKAYPGINEIPDEVDLAILLTPPDETLKVVEDCVRKHVKGIFIFTSGFGEKGAEGKKTEQTIGEIARSAGIRVVGPNSLGVYCPASRFLTFPSTLREVVPDETGSIGVFAHSGSFADFLTCILYKKGFRFSQVVSCGNECDLNAADFLEYMGQDKNTKIIVAYMEGIKEGKRFFELARCISKEKPIIIWKGGLTEAGARAAMSHTGSLAGSRHIWKAMFKQAGITGVSSFEEMLDCIQSFYFQPLPHGRRVAIISGQGGMGVATSDNCIDAGLELAKLSESTVQKLTGLLPQFGTSVNNPVDVGVAVLVAPHLYGESIKVIAEDENVDMFLIFTLPNRPCTQSIVEAAKDLKKPLVTTLFTLPELAPAEYTYLLQNRIPAYPDARRAALSLVKLAEHAEYIAKQ